MATFLVVPSSTTTPPRNGEQSVVQWRDANWQCPERRLLLRFSNETQCFQKKNVILWSWTAKQSLCFKLYEIWTALLVQTESVKWTSRYCGRINCRFGLWLQRTIQCDTKIKYCQSIDSDWRMQLYAQRDITLSVWIYSTILQSWSTYAIKTTLHVSV